MTMNNILGLFAKSPFIPLQRHAKKVVECNELLIPFFSKSFEGNWKEAEKIASQIARCESRADQLKREIRLNLPRGFFMPVERTDLLELITQQDKLANIAKDIVGRVIGRELMIPVSLQHSFLRFLQRVIDSAQQSYKVVSEMSDLLESGFRGREVQFVNEMILELDTIEHDTDKLQRALRKELYRLEHELNTIDAIFLYEIIEWLGGIADQAQRVGVRIEIMIVKS